MLDIVAEVNRMVQNGNTSALFSPVNEYDWVSSDQVFIGKDPLTALKRGDFKRVSSFLNIYRYLRNIEKKQMNTV